MISKKKNVSGFSLVEVAIAMAVASFCLITIAGLLSVGLSSSQTSSQESIMSNVAGHVAADLRATSAGLASPFYQIAFPLAGGSTLTAPVTIYVKADGSPAAAAANADYAVWIGINPPAAGALGATTVRIVVTWPPQAAPHVSATTGFPTTYSGSYETMFAINRN